MREYEKIMECKLPFCACKHILPHPRVFCVKTALKGGEFRGKCGEMQGGAGSSGNYSLRHAAEDKPRTARHLPEEEAKMRKTPSVCFADTSLLYRAPKKDLPWQRFLGKRRRRRKKRSGCRKAIARICALRRRGRQGNEEFTDILRRWFGRCGGRRRRQR